MRRRPTFGETVFGTRVLPDDAASEEGPTVATVKELTDTLATADPAAEVTYQGDSGPLTWAGASVESGGVVVQLTGDKPAGDKPTSSGKGSGSSGPGSGS
jgi:hypothetical protein